MPSLAPRLAPRLTSRPSLASLAREVYTAYRASKGSEEGLRHLIQQHAPHPTATQNPQTPPPASNQTAITTPTDPKSSTILAPQPNIGAGRGADSVPDAVLEVFERNRKLRPLK